MTGKLISICPELCFPLAGFMMQNIPESSYGRNLIFLDAYYMLAETVEKGTWDPITSRNNFVSRNRCFMLMKCIL